MPQTCPVATSNSPRNVYQTKHSGVCSKAMHTQHTHTNTLRTILLHPVNEVYAVLFTTSSCFLLLSLLVLFVCFVCLCCFCVLLFFVFVLLFCCCFCFCFFCLFVCLFVCCVVVCFVVVVVVVLQISPRK